MFLAHVLGIASGDLRYINELLEIIVDNQFSYEVTDNQLGYEVREELGDLTLSQIDQNTLLHAIFSRINSKVFNQIKQKIEDDSLEISNEADKETLLSLCQERIDNFWPDINSVDSYFNNELDEVIVRGNTLNQIVDAVIPHLLENA